MRFQILVLPIIAIAVLLYKAWLFETKRKRRRDYYRNGYLKSDEWKRKRYVVLKRDNWRCVYCGRRATQVHHKKYATRNIGKEPIHWLVSICKSCHLRTAPLMEAKFDNCRSRTYFVLWVFNDCGPGLYEVLFSS